MGPNDMSDASFGPKVCLLFFSLHFNNFFCLFRFYLCYKETGRVGLDGDEKNGPKWRIRRVIWAILGMFSFFLHVFTHFFCLFGFYSCYKGTGRVGLASDEKNGPKRRVWRCLGHRYVFFYFLCVLLIFSVLFRFYLHFKTTGRVGLNSDEKNGPKGIYIFFYFAFFLF